MKRLYDKAPKDTKEVDYSKLGYMPDTYKAAQNFFEKEGYMQVPAESKIFLENCSLHHLSENTIKEFGKQIIENGGAVSNQLIVDKMDAIKEVEIEMAKLERVIEEDISAAGFQPVSHVVSGMKQLNIITQRMNTMADIACYSKMQRQEIVNLCGGKDHAAIMVQNIAESFRKQEVELNRERLMAKPPKMELHLQGEMEI